MITKEQILNLIDEELKNSEIFLVDISISASNEIMVFIDSLNGISIDDCVNISRKIEHNLDREAEDFHLEVSSPGLDLPFRVTQQYFKNIGKELEVLKNDGIKLKGTLKSCNESEIELEVTETKKDEKKKKITVTSNHIINYNQIKKAQLIIKFK